jgi:Cu2+-exporting ATPase/Cu+-exporting ATPase
VAGFLRRQGLSETFYDLRRQDPPVCPIPVEPSTEGYEYVDDPEFLAKMSLDGGRSLRVYLEGLSCSACVWLLESLPRFVSDCESARLNWHLSTIDLTLTQGGRFSAILSRINQLGYRPQVVRGHDEIDLQQRRERQLDLIRIGVAAASAGNIMLLTVSVYGGAEGIWRDGFNWISLALALPTLTFSAWPLYRSSLRAFRARDLNIDLPIVAALLAGVVMSLWSMIWGSGELAYFDSLTMLVFLLSSSRYWLRRTQERYLNTRHLEDYLFLGSVGVASSLGPQSTWQRRSVLAVRPGERVHLKAGQILPFDARLVSDRAEVDSALLTGEFRTRLAQAGEFLSAGHKVLEDAEFLVAETAQASRLMQVVRDAEAAKCSQPRVQELSDRASRWFVAVVFALAIGLSALFTFLGQPLAGFERALALIIVTCPCVFAFAIPLSMSLALRRSADLGLLVSGSRLWENLLNVRRVVFDKTGTLTDGAYDITVIENWSSSPDAVWSDLLALEHGQNHPLAHAIIREGLRRGAVASTTLATDVIRLPQGGIRGQVGSQSIEVRTVGDFTHEVWHGGRRAILIRAQDRLRDEAKAVVSQIRSQGLEVALLSGDRGEAVREVADSLVLDPQMVESGATPESKAQIIRRWQSERCLMVGDGANDGVALGTAGAGIAIRGGLGLSLKSADAYITTGSLQTIPMALRMAQAVRFDIKRNLSVSVAFNLLAGSLAILGLMTPLWAAVLMPISSFCVLALSLSGRVQGVKL